MRMFAHKRCGRLDRQKNEVGLLKYHACRRHARCHHPCGNLGIPPATEAARKRLHASAAKATSVRTCFCINSGSGTPSTTMASPTVTPTAPSAAELVAPTRYGRYLWRPQGRECVAQPPRLCRTVPRTTLRVHGGTV